MSGKTWPLTTCEAYLYIHVVDEPLNVSYPGGKSALD